MYFTFRALTVKNRNDMILSIGYSQTLVWSDKIYLTDAKDVNYKHEPEGKFTISATKDGMGYEISLFDEINVEVKRLEQKKAKKEEEPTAEDVQEVKAQLYLQNMSSKICFGCPLPCRQTLDL
ncbi:hypothetical protein FRX31_019542 [Thalictrum thalictroides]|uniref:Uncharacterized protein n=1 Tax=Thalictrum thalictroides TaxID=46969 RepID=A0A7J6W123_THATH|nr:hypothetical protein FRX31_019542 [Thalictrum thalictroides]